LFAVLMTIGSASRRWFVDMMNIQLAAITKYFVQIHAVFCIVNLT
jgi:hypothetical protein